MFKFFGDNPFITEGRGKLKSENGFFSTSVILIRLDGIW